MHGLLSAFLALGAFQALTVTAQDPACLANCASQVRADFTKFSCANADDAGCLCVNADFKNGVRDCATPCGSTDGDVDTFLNDGFCLAIAPPAEAPSSEAAPQPESTQAPAPESTAAPETSAAPEPTTVAEPEEEPQPTPVPETTAEELAQDTTTEPVQPETTAAPESTSAVAETESSTTLSTRTRSASNAGETTGANEDEEKEDDKKDDEDEGGLSQTAIIGIGVGAGAAGLAAVGLLVWLCLRKRNKQDARPFIEISKPMPASGAGDYTGRRDPFAEKRGDVIEMQSNRYEDMLPRQEPRTVV